MWSDAAADCLGGYRLRPELEIEVLWRFDFGGDARTQLPEQVRGWDNLWINVFELLGMAVTAWLFVTQLGIAPSSAQDAILMLGDDMSVYLWSESAWGVGAQVGGTYAFLKKSGSRQ